ncbi:hypothetical protein F4779DRAFT_122586 [Xylariaceae sp. FL0662B]|nr:hypothetical protein F4779DRAFT_122586 [Xylariaceae sp. FL0662B]
MKLLVTGLIAALASVVSASEGAPEGDATTRAPWHPPHPTPTSISSSSSSSTSTTFIISITTLPGHPTTTAACPTVTQTTRPSGCDPVRCPVPECTLDQELFVPCGCGIQTALFVDGCQTACPSGCITRTTTLSAVCATETPAAV